MYFHMLGFDLPMGYCPMVDRTQRPRSYGSHYDCTASIFYMSVKTLQITDNSIHLFSSHMETPLA